MANSRKQRCYLELTPEGKLMQQMIKVFAEFEREIRSQRIKKGMALTRAKRKTPLMYFRCSHQAKV